MKRIPAGLVAALAVLATGVATSACTTTPSAAAVNGSVIAVSDLNTELNGLSSTAAGQCLLSLNFPQTAGLSAVGTGVAGTYRTDFAALVLGNDVDNLLAAQYLVGHKIHVSANDITLAQATFTTVIDGAIAAQAQQAAAVGGTSGCQQPDGSPYTGKTLLSGLPTAVRNTELTNQAVEQILLTRGADLSDAAVLGYYVANPSQFVKDCVSGIETTDQATADTAYNSLKAGTPFAQVASSATANPAASARSGQVGCFSEATVMSQLQLPSVANGQAVAPVSSNGTWVDYVVTSRTVIPVDQAASSIRLALTRSTANRKRVSNEVQAFARISSVQVNPQYGTWVGAQIKPPASPAPRYLLPQYGAVPSTTTTAPTPLNPANAVSGSGSAGG